MGKESKNKNKQRQSLLIDSLSLFTTAKAAGTNKLLSQSPSPPGAPDFPRPSQADLIVKLPADSILS